jgi:hypothetical protein
MKKTILILLLGLLSSLEISAQVASSCNVPAILKQEYQRDWVNLSMTAMFAAQSPDTQFVRVPDTWLGPISEGMAAIFNASSIPQRDSVFDLYCVHDLASYIQTYPGYLVQIDTQFAWTSAWRNLITLTGDATLDSMLVKYGLQVTQFLNWSFGQYALLNTDSLWNNRALIDSLETIPGIIYAEPDALIGGAGRIEYSLVGSDRYYDFFFQFNDCFDGCDNYRKWSFRVAADCSVEYLGFQDFGVFGIEPLPAPSNCNITTDITAPQPYSFEIGPNPVSENLCVAITVPHGTPACLKMHDPTGREILNLQWVGPKVEIPVSHLASGLYHLTLSTPDGRPEHRKFLKL